MKSFNQGVYVEMAKHAKASPQDFIYSVLFDFFNLIRVGGFRVAEYAQKTRQRLMNMSIPWEARLLRLLSLLIGTSMVLVDL